MSRQAEGRVTDARGAPLAGIAVSNGERIVLSGRDGRFRLSVDPDRHAHVFVSLPSGWDAANGFYRNLEQCHRGETAFVLRRRRGTGGGVPFVVITDIHYGHLPPSGAAATRALRHELKALARRLPRSRFIIAAGDLTERGVRGDLLKVRQLFEESQRPVFPMFGNHDYITEAKTPGNPKPWSRHYLEIMGPTWYSFDWSGFHFTLYVNQDFALSEPMIAARNRWLAADLRLAAQRGLEKIVVCHFPPSMSFARRLARLGVRLLVTGHFHCFRTYRLGGLRVVGIPSFMRGGIDMMPRGALEVNARSGKDIRFQFVPLAPAFDRTRPLPRRRVIWSRKVSDYFHRSGPVLDGEGRLYVAGSADLRGGVGRVHCLDAERGRRIWGTPVDGAVKSGVTLDGDRVWALTQTGTLFCLDRSDGRVVWKRRLAQSPDRWLNAPPVVCKGVVVAGHSGGGIEAFDARSGRRIWHVNADRAPFVNSAGDVWPNYTAPVTRDGRVVIPFRGSSLQCFAARTGTAVWRFDVPFDFYMPEPVVWRDSIWVPNRQPGDDLSRVDLATGTVVARARSKGITVSWSASDDSLFLVVLDKWIGGQGRLQCRSAVSGRFRWERVLGHDTAHAYQYYAFDGPNSQAAPVLFKQTGNPGDPRLYVSCTDGTLRAFDPDSGRGLGAIDLGSPMFTAPVFREERFWANLWSGHVVCGTIGLRY